MGTLMRQCHKRRRPREVGCSVQFPDMAIASGAPVTLDDGVGLAVGPQYLFGLETYQGLSRALVVSEAVPAGTSFTLPLGDFDALSTLILLASSSGLGKLFWAEPTCCPHSQQSLITGGWWKMALAS